MKLVKDPKSLIASRFLLNAKLENPSRMSLVVINMYWNHWVNKSSKVIHFHFSMVMRGSRVMGTRMRRTRMMKTRIRKTRTRRARIRRRIRTRETRIRRTRIKRTRMVGTRMMRTRVVLGWGAWSLILLLMRVSSLPSCVVKPPLSVSSAFKHW